MKTRPVLVLLLLAVAFTGASAEVSVSPEPGNEDPAHDEIRALRDGLIKALQDTDADAVLEYLHPDVVLTSQDGQEQKVIRKHKGVRDYLDRQLTGENPYIKSLKTTVTVDELTILYGEDTGIAFGSTEDHYVLADGTETDLPTRWSATLVKHDGKWKIANLHFSTNLFDNPVLSGTKTMMYWVGGIAAIVGLILGIVLLKLFAKPSSTA